MQGVLQTIGSVCAKPSPGRLTHLYLISAGDFLFELPVSGAHETEPLIIGLKPGAPVTRIVLRAKTAGFSQASVLTPDGPHYTLSISVPIPAAANEVFAWVAANIRRRWVAVWRDTVGNCYVSGTRDNGLRLTWGHGSEEMHAHNLQLSGVQLRPAVLLESIDPEELMPAREFDHSFEISFS